MTSVSTSYDPLVSEFESAEHEAQYTAWLNEKVQRSVDDSRPRVPHDEVMAKMDALIARYAQPKVA